MSETATIAWINNPVPVGFAAVQTSAQHNSSTAAQTVTLNPTVHGNLVVVHIIVTDNTVTVTSITDDVGNTYVVGAPLNTIFNTYQAYGVQFTGGATTITINLSSSVFVYAGADEYSGNASSNAATYDIRSTGNSSVNPVQVSSFSPSITGELIVATIACDTNTAWTAGTGYTMYNGNAEDPNTALRSEYRLIGTTTETAPATKAGSGTWAEIATAFKQ